ncbi:MAG: LacI family DNA-binding transcriptional regulator [Chloroflexota bacterium]
MNLEEIARLSGVSRSTVSRVINNSPRVSEEARRKVLEIIQQTNFQPNIAARSLASGSTRILGLVIPTAVANLFIDPYFPLLIQGITAACNVRNYSIMLWLADIEYERRMIRQILYSGLVDGVVLASMSMNDPLLEALLEANRPFVVQGRDLQHEGVAYVDVDNLESSRHATLHLARLGRRRIAHITGPLNTAVGQDRRQGYESALQQSGLPYNPNLISEGDFTYEGGYQAMLRLLPHEPDSVFIASDTMAQGALRAIIETGRSVPEDIALVGFDDMPFASHMIPPLTTVRQPVQRMGSVAAETLIELIENPVAKPRGIRLPTELVIRASCGFALNTI